MIAPATKNGTESDHRRRRHSRGYCGIEAIERRGSLEIDFTFVSTGGGAMLDFLAQGTLVGIEALK